MKFDFDFPLRTPLRLCLVEEIIRKQRVILPPPSRACLIEMLEDGRLEGHKTTFGWVVYEDSFRKWVKSLHMPSAT